MQPLHHAMIALQRRHVPRPPAEALDSRVFNLFVSFFLFWAIHNIQRIGRTHQRAETMATLRCLALLCLLLGPTPRLARQLKDTVEDPVRALNEETGCRNVE